jgi:integrase/recombinase XerD
MTKYSVKFILKPVGGNEELQHIIVRVRVEQSKSEWNTSERSTILDWDQYKERSKDDELVNNRLAQIDQQVRKIINRFEMEKMPFTAQTVKDLYKGKFSHSVQLLEFYDFYLQRLREHGGYAKSTLTRYVGTRNMVGKFIKKKFRTNDVPIAYIDYSFVEAFDNYMRTTIQGIKSELPEHNTMSKNHSRFRSMIMKAINHKHIFFNPYKSFKITYKEDTRTFLNQLEIQRLIQVGLPTPQLQRVRDVFLFSCFTGLRFSDVTALTSSNMRRSHGKWALEVIQMKTKKRLEIPLFDTARDIIERYQHLSFQSGKLLPLITNQKTNGLLKVVADLAGISKNLTFHMSRHTFATTVLMDNGVPLEEIQALLGHSNIKETQKYARLTSKRLFDSDHINQVNSLMSKEVEKFKGGDNGQYKQPVQRIMW